MLDMFDAMIGAAAIDWARWAKQELVMVELVVNVETNAGNLNIPEVDKRKLAATIAKLKLALNTAGEIVLDTGAVLFSWSPEIKAGSEFWRTWATATMISLEIEVDAPVEAAVTST